MVLQTKKTTQVLILEVTTDIVL